MKTGFQILDYLHEELGVGVESISNENFSYELIRDHFKDKINVWVLQNLDRSDKNLDELLFETIPGASEHPCVVYPFMYDEKRYLQMLRHYLAVGEDAVDLLETEATITEGLTVAELEQLLNDDEWEFYGRVSTAINRYMIPLIASAIDCCVMAWVEIKTESSPVVDLETCKALKAG